MELTVEQLFGTLQQSVVATWRKHLKTAKYSKHMALDEFYNEMPELVDKLIETYMGAKGGKVKGYENILQSSNQNTLKYLGELKKIVKSGYGLIGNEPDVKACLDDILELINSTLYKVKELSESCISLSDYIKESLNDNVLLIESKIKTIEDLYDFAKKIKIPTHSKFKTEVTLDRDFSRPSDRNTYDIVSISLMKGDSMLDVERFLVQNGKVYRLASPGMKNTEIPEDKLNEVLTFIAKKISQNKYYEKDLQDVNKFLAGVINKLN